MRAAPLLYAFAPVWMVEARYYPRLGFWIVSNPTRLSLQFVQYCCRDVGVRRASRAANFPIFYSVVDRFLLGGLSWRR